MTNGFEARKAKLFGGANIYSDPAASGGSAVGFLGHVGDGIECRSPLLTGRGLKIRYAALVTTTLTLQVNNVVQRITFPATGDWSGEDAYGELTVPVVIPEKAVVEPAAWPG